MWEECGGEWLVFLGEGRGEGGAGGETGSGGDTVVCVFNIGINVLVLGLNGDVARAGGGGRHGCCLMSICCRLMY